MTNPRDIVHDFAKRTKVNLSQIDRSRINGEEVYEVTQLINSLLGLIVFPKEKYYLNIPETSLDELVENGWPRIQVVGGFQPAANLRMQMRYLRNAVAHFNLDFIPDASNDIAGIRVWNIKDKEMNWQAEIPLTDLRLLVDKFINLILSEVEG